MWLIDQAFQCSCCRWPIKILNCGSVACSRKAQGREPRSSHICVHVLGFHIPCCLRAEGNSGLKENQRALQLLSSEGLSYSTAHAMLHTERRATEIATVAAGMEAVHIHNLPTRLHCVGVAECHLLAMHGDSGLPLKVNGRGGVGLLLHVSGFCSIPDECYIWRGIC